MQRDRLSSCLLLWVRRDGLVGRGVVALGLCSLFGAHQESTQRGFRYPGRAHWLSRLNEQSDSHRSTGSPTLAALSQAHFHVSRCLGAGTAALGSPLLLCCPRHQPPPKPRPGSRDPRLCRTSAALQAGAAVAGTLLAAALTK